MVKSSLPIASPALTEMYFQSSCYLIENFIVQEILVDEESLHGVAGCRVVGLCVLNNLHGLLHVAVLVKVDVTYPVRVAQHGDPLRPFLDGADQVVAAAGDDEIDVLVQL